MQIVMKRIDELKHYEKNNKKHPEKQIAKLVDSIKEFGFKNPVLIDKDNVIIAGHGRTIAAEKIGMTEVPCIDCSDLNTKQVKALRLMDNKSADLAEWDFENVQEELKSLFESGYNTEFTGFEFNTDDGSEKDSIYTDKIKAPTYEPTGEKPEVSELVNIEKMESLIEEINNSDVKLEEKEFLINAAKRHIVFNYKNIAEYYSHAEKEMQELMEKSALVIIDFDKAIEYGYLKIRNDFLDMMEEDEEDE